MERGCPVLAHRKGFQFRVPIPSDPCSPTRQALQVMQERPREGKSLGKGHTAKQGEHSSSALHN